MIFKNFFDRILQKPFRLLVRSYRIQRNSKKKLFQKIGFKYILRQYYRRGGLLTTINRTESKTMSTFPEAFRKELVASKIA